MVAKIVHLHFISVCICICICLCFCICPCISIYICICICSCISICICISIRICICIQGLVSTAGATASAFPGKQLPICIPTQGGRNPNTAPNTPHQIPNTPPYPPWITNTSFIPTNYTTQDKKNGILNPKRYSKYSNLVTPCYIWFLQSGCLMLYLYFQANKKYIAGKSGSRLYAAQPECQKAFYGRF